MTDGLLATDLFDEVDEIVGGIERVAPLSGGCVSEAYRIESREGPFFFLKANRGAPADFFEVEAEGLASLAHADDEVRVPDVVGHGRTGSTGWLMLEWLEESRATARSFEQLGRGLAEIHRRTGESWGWHRDGYIGTLPQSNRRTPNWSDFWYRERIRPQLQMAQGGRSQVASVEEWGELRERLPALLRGAEDEGPSLLHGDLWSGNAMTLKTGPALVDPACYYGHREVDLALAELFGGFDRTFFEAYAAAWPLAPGYRARRRVYQIYYLLVHVNLFGDEYIPRTTAALRAALSA